MLVCTSSYSDGTMTRTESIALPGDPGPDPWPVAKMTTTVTPAAGEMFGRIGDLIELVYRTTPRDGFAWVAPCAVNCARHGLISCEPYEWRAWKAGREHLAADHPEAAWIPAAWRERYPGDADRDAERVRWNAALASGDAETIARVRHETLDAVYARIMADDQYQERTH